MQRKTISKIITKKLEEWLSTISKDDLRKDVKSSIVVSGGCIASMFLNVEVNDYDIYLKDTSVARRLAEYYTEKFQNVLIYSYSDLEKFKNRMEQDSLFASFLRNMKENQVKLLVEGEYGGLVVNEGKNPEDLNYDPIFFSPNAISLSNQVQVVLRFTGSPEEIHKTFDFVHATNYFTFEEGLVTNIRALESLISKTLYYQGSFYPITSVIRMKKFIKRGYTISAGEILKMAFQISDLDLTDMDVLEDQLIGVDVAYFQKLIEVLKTVQDETKLKSPNYISEIIDRVFNSIEGEENE